MKRKYEKPSTKIVKLRQRTRLLSTSGDVRKLDSFDNGGDPLAG